MRGPPLSLSNSNRGQSLGDTTDQWLSPCLPLPRPEKAAVLIAKLIFFILLLAITIVLIYFCIDMAGTDGRSMADDLAKYAG